VHHVLVPKPTEQHAQVYSRRDARGGSGSGAPGGSGGLVEAADPRLPLLLRLLLLLLLHRSLLLLLLLDLV